MWLGYRNFTDIARISGLTMQRTDAVLRELLWEQVIQYNPYKRGEEWELPA